jgi:hypothetical protein
MVGKVRAALWIVTLVVLSACGADERDPAMDPLTPLGIPEVAPAETAPAAAQVVTIREMHGSGIRGTAVLTPGDTAVRAEIVIEGTVAGASHAARIYAGSCADPGAVLSELDPILADGPRVRVERLIAQTPLNLMSGQASLMIYPSGGMVAGPGAACGPIPRQPAAAPEVEGGLTEPAVLPAEPPAAPR